MNHWPLDGYQPLPRRRTPVLSHAEEARRVIFRLYGRAHMTDEDRADLRELERLTHPKRGDRAAGKRRVLTPEQEAGIWRLYEVRDRFGVRVHNYDYISKAVGTTWEKVRQLCSPRHGTGWRTNARGRSERL